MSDAAGDRAHDGPTAFPAARTLACVTGERR